MNDQLLFQYPSLVAPSDAALGASAVTLDMWDGRWSIPVWTAEPAAEYLFAFYVEPLTSEDITLDKWFQPPADVILEPERAAEGWYCGLVFDLPDQPVQVDQWFTEIAIVPWADTPASIGDFAFYAEPLPTVVPDIAFLQCPEPVLLPVEAPPSGMVAPFTPIIPARADEFFVPQVQRFTTPYDQDRGRAAINMLGDIVNSLIRRGQLRFFGVGDWRFVLSSSEIVEFLGYTPEYAAPAPPPPPPPPPSGNTIVSITLDSVTSNTIVTTAAPHGLTGTGSVTIAGTSFAFYNGLRLYTYVSPSVFTINVGWIADSSGGTWS